MEYVQTQQANEALDTVHKISNILDTGLDKTTLSILIALCESGVNPEVRQQHCSQAIVHGHPVVIQHCAPGVKYLCRRLLR